VTITAECVVAGDVAIFLLNDTTVDCTGAATAAGGTAHGGVVSSDLKVSVSLPEGMYKLCVAKAADADSGSDDDFEAFGDDGLLRVRDNVRTRPWEPHVEPEPYKYEDDDCTMSELFCRHNRSAPNRTSTAEAGNVETGRNESESRWRRFRRFRNLGDNIRNRDWGSKIRDHDWGHRLDNWSDYALESNNPFSAWGYTRDRSPQPPPPPLSPGQQWQDHECDMASWLCPKNRSRTGMVPEGPGGISMWATSTDGDPHGVGVAWWWLLLVLAILLLCCCCVFCFLGFQRRNLAPTPDLSEIGSGPVVFAKNWHAKTDWSGGNVATRPPPAAAATQT